MTQICIENTAPSPDENGLDDYFYLAAWNARKRNFQEALRLLPLAMGHKHCSESRALDLEARIYAQQGRLGLAGRCWEKALELDPTNPAILSALDRLTRVRKPWFRVRFILNLFSVAVILGVLIVIVSGFIDVRSRQQTILRRLGEIESKYIAPPSVKASPNFIPLTIEAGTGYRIFSRKDIVVVSFTAPLFSHGLEFTSGARLVLADLAGKLVLCGEYLHVEVVGHADAKPVLKTSVFRDNEELALARAVATISLLRRESGLTSQSFSAMGLIHAESEGIPLPGVGNRTVSLLVRRIPKFLIPGLE